MFKSRLAYLITALLLCVILVPLTTNLAFKQLEVDSLSDPRTLSSVESVPLEKVSPSSVKSFPPPVAHSSELSSVPGITMTKPLSAAESAQKVVLLPGKGTADGVLLSAKASASSGASARTQDSVAREVLAEGVTISKRPGLSEKKTMQEKQIIAW